MGRVKWKVEVERREFACTQNNFKEVICIERRL